MRKILDTIINENGKEVLVDISRSKESAYLWYHEQFWQLPTYTDGTFEHNLEYCCVIEESPEKYKQELIDSLRLYKLKNQTINVIINNISFYDSGD